MNLNEVIPTTYESWKHCITVRCKIELTSGFIEERMSVYGDPESIERKAFSDRYGEAHCQNVYKWLERAKSESKA